MKRKGVVTHRGLDLDCVVCAILSGANQKDIHFIPANAKSLPERCPCCGKELPVDIRILDHPLGIKGGGQNDEHAAAAAIMAEAANCDPLLIAEVNEQDGTGLVKHPAFSLSEIMKAIIAQRKKKGKLRGPAFDRNIIRYMRVIIEGINIRFAQLRIARQAATEARIETIGKFKVAIESPPVEMIQQALKENGVSCVIWKNNDGIGINLLPGTKGPDLKKLAKHLHGWFLASTGHVLMWGGRKSTVKGPPPEGTPQTREDLADLMRKVYGK